MPANWQAVQDATFAWAVAASGYPSDKVIWRDQDGFAPSGDYIILSILGSDTVEGPLPPRTDRDPAKPPGQEVILTVGGTRSVLIEAQVLTSQTITATDALAVAEKMRTRTSLPSVRDILLSAGISPYDQGTVQQVNQVRADEFRRAGGLSVSRLSRGLGRGPAYVHPKGTSDRDQLRDGRRRRRPSVRKQNGTTPAISSSSTFWPQWAGSRSRALGTPLILGYTPTWVERVRYYSDLAGIATDLGSTSPEYKCAQTILRTDPATGAPRDRTWSEQTDAAVQAIDRSGRLQQGIMWSGLNGTDYTINSGATATKRLDRRPSTRPSVPPVPLRALPAA